MSGHSLHRAGVHDGMGVDVAPIGLKQHRVIAVDRRRVIGTAQLLHPQAEHRPPAAQRGACILGMDQHVALAHVTETGIGGGDQITRGIGQSAVEIENDCLHWVLLGRNPALQNGIVLQTAI